MNKDNWLERQLSLIRPYVDIARVCDGARLSNTRQVCRKYDTEYYYRKWDDNYSAQDNKLLRDANDGEWILIMDSDEFPSEELLSNLRNLAKQGEYEGFDCVRIPSILVLDSIPDYTVEDTIRLTKERRPLFRKDWFFKYTTEIYAKGSPHRLFCHPNGWNYYNTGYPYYHIKTTNDFILNDCIHSFINPEGQDFTLEQGNELHTCNCIKQLKLSTELIPLLQKGDITSDLMDFMWKYKDEDAPISRWFWSYYFLFHNDKLPTDFDYKNDISYNRFLKCKVGYKEFEVNLNKCNYSRMQ